MKLLPHVSAGARRSRALTITTVFVTLLAIVPAAAPARAQSRPDDALITRSDATVTALATALDKLSVARRGGEPFAIQESEILDAWEAGLPVAGIEAEILASRAIYDVYVAGRRTARQVENDLVGRWRSYLGQHALDLQARNLRLNQDLGQQVQPPDGSREWELYSDPALFNQIDGYQRRLERLYGRKGRARRGARAGEAETGELPDVALALPNTLVNNPAADTTAQDTQSETAIVLGAGTNILSAFNDSGSNVGGAAHFTGVARSTDGGTAFTDNGAPPNSGTGDAGDPVLARSASTGTAILATLGFNSSAALQTFRSTDNGATFLAPVDADGGGTNNDKEWIVADNFAGAGQGNFYLFYRDFGGGGGMSFTRSTDDGATWSARQLLAAGSGQGAWLAVGADHTVYAFWLSGTSIVLRKSTDRGLTFGAQSTVTTLRTAGVNGDLGLGGGFRTNAFPQVVANPAAASQLYMTWNDKAIAGPDKANVYFSQSTDGGTTWSAPLQVNTDAGTNDNFMPCLAITPDGTGLFVSWYDRRLDVANSQIDVFGRNATISGTTVTFATDYRITDASFPSVIGQDPVINSVYMGDYDMAVADNTAFYRTWGDNRLPLGGHANQPDVRYTTVPKAGPGAILTAGSASIVSEGCTPPNGALDPGEIVTVSFGVTNAGTAPTVNLVGTLLATGGVTSPSGPATYGVVAPGGSASQSFSFTATGSCGGPLTASLQLQDGATNLGTVSWSFVLGTTSTQTFSNAAAITINDNAAATPYPSNITVSGVSAYSRVTLTLTGLSHTFPADIDVIVVAPGGQAAYVMSDVGAGTDVVSVNLTFDDNAGTALGNGAIVPGTFKPSNIDTTSDVFPAPAPAGPYSPTFGVFGGLGAGANGTWSLYVRDDAGTDVGSVAGGWSLSFLAPQCSGTCTPVELQGFNIE